MRLRGWLPLDFPQSWRALSVAHLFSAAGTLLKMLSTRFPTDLCARRRTAIRIGNASVKPNRENTEVFFSPRESSFDSYAVRLPGGPSARGGSPRVELLSRRKVRYLSRNYDFSCSGHDLGRRRPHHFCVCHSEQVRDRMLHCMDRVAGGRPKPEADCHEPQLLARLRLQGTASDFLELARYSHPAYSILLPNNPRY